MLLILLSCPYAFLIAVVGRSSDDFERIVGDNLFLI